MESSPDIVSFVRGEVTVDELRVSCGITLRRLDVGKWMVEVGGRHDPVEVTLADIACGLVRHSEAASAHEWAAIVLGGATLIDIRQGGATESDYDRILDGVRALAAGQPAEAPTLALARSLCTR